MFKTKDPKLFHKDEFFSALHSYALQAADGSFPAVTGRQPPPSSQQVVATERSSASSACFTAASSELEGDLAAEALELAAQAIACGITSDDGEIGSSASQGTSAMFGQMAKDTIDGATQEALDEAARAQAAAEIPKSLAALEKKAAELLGEERVRGSASAAGDVSHRTPSEKTLTAGTSDIEEDIAREALRNAAENASKEDAPPNPVRSDLESYRSEAAFSATSTEVAQDVAASAVVRILDPETGDTHLAGAADVPQGPALAALEQRAVELLGEEAVHGPAATDTARFSERTFTERTVASDEVERSIAQEAVDQVLEPSTVAPSTDQREPSSAVQATQGTPVADAVDVSSMQRRPPSPHLMTDRQSSGRISATSSELRADQARELLDVLVDTFLPGQGQEAATAGLQQIAAPAPPPDSHRKQASGREAQASSRSAAAAPSQRSQVPVASAREFEEPYAYQQDEPSPHQFQPDYVGYPSGRASSRSTRSFTSMDADRERVMDHTSEGIPWSGREEMEGMAVVLQAAVDAGVELEIPPELMDMSFTTPPPSQPVPPPVQTPPQAMGSTMDSTGTGMGSTGRPFIPQLWDPQPRSDGFPASGWEAPDSVSSRGGYTDSQPASMRVPEPAYAYSSYQPDDSSYQPDHSYMQQEPEQPELDIFGLPADDSQVDGSVPVFMPSSRSMGMDQDPPEVLPPPGDAGTQRSSHRSGHKSKEGSQGSQYGDYSVNASSRAAVSEEEAPFFAPFFAAGDGEDMPEWLENVTESASQLFPGDDSIGTPIFVPTARSQTSSAAAPVMPPVGYNDPAERADSRGSDGRSLGVSEQPQTRPDSRSSYASAVSSDMGFVPPENIVREPAFDSTGFSAVSSRPDAVPALDIPRPPSSQGSSAPLSSGVMEGIIAAAPYLAAAAVAYAEINLEDGEIPPAGQWFLPAAPSDDGAGVALQPASSRSVGSLPRSWQGDEPQPARSRSLSVRSIPASAGEEVEAPAAEEVISGGWIAPASGRSGASGAVARSERSAAAPSDHSAGGRSVHSQPATGGRSGGYIAAQSGRSHTSSVSQDHGIGRGSYPGYEASDGTPYAATPAEGVAIGDEIDMNLMAQAMEAMVDDEEMLGMFMAVANQFDAGLFADAEQEPPPSADARSRVPPIPMSQVQSRYPVQTSTPPKEASSTSEVVAPAGIAPGSDAGTVPTDKEESVAASQEDSEVQGPVIVQQPSYPAMVQPAEPVAQPPIEPPTGSTQQQPLQQAPTKHSPVQPPVQVPSSSSQPAPVANIPARDIPRDSGMSDAIHDLADALRHVGDELNSNRSGSGSGKQWTLQSPLGSDVGGYSFRSASSVGLDQVRGVVAGVVDDLFQGYDEIEVLEIFFDAADYDSIDHAQFKQAILDNFRVMGLTEEEIGLLKVTLRPGRVIAQVSGPVHIIAALRELPLKRMVVLGHQAKVTEEIQRDVARELTTQGATFNEIVPEEAAREQAAQEVVQGIENALRQETPVTSRSGRSHIEESVVSHALSARAQSQALEELTDGEIRALVKEALDVWFSDREEVSVPAPGARSVPAVEQLVRIPRPSSADLEQLTARLYTGRSVYSTASSEQREDITMNFLMEMQTPLLAAAEAAPPLPRPSPEALEQMTARVVARNAPPTGVAPDITTNREVVIRDLFAELTSVLFGGSPMSTARVPVPFQRGRPDEQQVESMAQRILSSHGQSHEGQAEAVRAMLTELTGAIFDPVTSRSTFETHTARSQQPAQSLRTPSQTEIERMALAVAQRHGQTTADPQVINMLNSMSGNLFGSAPVASPQAQSAGLRRPSPRGIEEMTRRVVASTENGIQEEVVEQVLVELTDALFGSEPQQRIVSRPASGGLNRPSSRSLDQAASRLTTARSVAQSSIGGESRGARSQSTNPEDVQAAMNMEIRDLLGGLCNALFGDTPTPTGRR
jgi:hypothetical protein